MDKKDSVILGYDMVSPLGAEMGQQWDRASRGESGVGPLTRFPMDDQFPVRVAGQVAEIDVDPFPFLKPRELAHWTSPIFKHSLLVVHRALKAGGIEITPDIAPRVAVTFSSAVGGLDAVLRADRLMVSDHKLPHPFTNPNSCINMVGGKVSILTGATGPITATITACATGCTSMIIGAMFIRMDLADVVICGAADFCLVEPILAGFATMNGAMKHKAGEPVEPEKASRPFSLDRKGFIVSEGAGCVIIASREFAAAHGLRPSLEIAGWGMSSDASHFVAPNHDTVKRCVTESISRAGIAPSDIGSVNAHATSTKIGDKIESDVLREVFPGRVPPVTANKSLIGHAMGASSALESIFAMEGMIRGAVLPTINYIPDPEIDLPVATELLGRDQEFLLKNSFGFGGCNSCIVFKRTS